MNSIGRSNNILRAALAAGVSILVAASSIEAADLDARIDFTIGSQSLSSALMQFADQSKIQVITASSSLDGHATAGVRGRLTAGAALNAILEGTGLSYKEVGDGTITITKKDKYGDASESSTGQLLRYTTDELLLAQADTSAVRDSESGQATTSTGEFALEEVVVTAQRRKETLQDVPISITVLGGEQLDRSTVSGATEALRSIPGFDSELNQYSANGASFSVRGVSNSTARGGGAGPIAYYVDGIPFGFVRNAFYPDPSVYDLDQIEFLSGPQGTLYGAGSLNGVIRILTHDANADKFELKARTAGSRTEDGGNNYRADLAVNVPIVEGKLGMRAVVGGQKESGWIDAPNRRDVNDEETRNYRLKLHAQPTDTLSVNLSAWRSESDIGAPALSNASQAITSVRAQPGSQQFDAYGIDVSQAFSGFTFSSMTSYIDFNSAALVDGTPAFSFSILDTRYAAEVFAQEFNLVSNGNGHWRWSAGAFYRQAEDITYQFQNFDSPATVDRINNDFTDESESYAVYGEIGRDLTEDLSLAVGLRYFHDDEEMYLNQRYPIAPQSALPVRAPFPSTSEAWTPRTVLTWTPGEDLSMYASYSQGFRSGFSQQPNVQALYPNFTPVEPDRLSNYEIGAKGSVLDGGLSYEAAIFYIDWQDVQQNLRVDLQPGTGLVTTATVNGESASGVGASFALTARPFEGLELGANASWNDLTVDADITQTNANGTTTVLFPKGTRLNQSPEYTFGASALYSWNLGGGYMGRVGFNGTYKSPQSAHGAGTESDSILVAGATFTVDAPRNWAFTLFADNVTDEDGVTTYTPFPAEWSTRQRPRTMGLQISYNFGQ